MESGTLGFIMVGQKCMGDVTEIISKFSAVIHIFRLYTEQTDMRLVLIF